MRLNVWKYFKKKKTLFNVIIYPKTIQGVFMANESIEGKAYQLKDILATELSAYYQIPTYQRPYQWTEENCEKLLDDLLSSYECYKESDYFCGSLVLIAISKDSETNATTYDIVDGQQRLSTFILLAKVLATIYDKDKDLNKTSRDFLEKSLGDTDGEKRKRLIFDTIGLNTEKDFQNALDFFDDLDASKGENSKSNDPSKGKNRYLKNAICLKNYLEKKKRLKTLTISLNGCILRSYLSKLLALISVWR